MSRLSAQALVCLLLTVTCAQAQTVKQSGHVTPGHAAAWQSNGTIKDAGPATNGGLTSLGVTSNGGPAICVNSAPTTQPFNRLCFSVSTNGGATISSDALGGATTPGITFSVNGSAQGFPTVTGVPVTSDDLVCFDGTAGSLKDCGAAISNLPTGLNNVRLAKTANYTVQNVDGNKTIALGGSAEYTLTFNAASGYDSVFQARVINEDTAENKILAINGLSDIALGPGQTITVYAQNNIWKTDWNQNGNVYFRSGRPWADVRAFGAKGDDSTDDTAAIQAAIDAVTALGQGGGGMVYFPTGQYCIKTGPLVVGDANNFGVRLVGEGASQRSGPYLTACGEDVSIVDLNATQSSIEWLGIIGSQTIGTANPAITLNDRCNTCVVLNSWISGGSYNVVVTGSDLYMTQNIFNVSYGSAIIKQTDTASGLTLMRNQVDIDTPTGSRPARGSTIGARQNTHAYATNDWATLDGFYIQATAGGISGGSPPTLLGYGQDITDGNVTWQIAFPVGQCGLEMANSSGVQAINNDFSGTRDSHICMTGASPQGLFALNNTFDGALRAGILANNGFALQVLGNAFNNCVFAGCAGVELSESWIGSAIVSDNRMQTNDYGVNISAGINTTVSSNQVFDSLIAGVFAAADVGVFVISANMLGASAAGANDIGVLVAVGTSDHYNIVNNIVFGATSAGVTDGGTGVNKTVSGNN